ncbi:MAG: T9SS type A sorting domain-containing protein [Candidatus Zixiibacteriota bacterium]|nr:MAG: T9SS type A sorting domain-containing protein [candidate division Zixibacteria bacterium]
MPNSKALICIAIILSVLMASGAINAQTVLNHYRLGTQRMPLSERLSNGNILVGWESLASGRRGPLLEVYTPDFSPLHSVDQYAASNHSLASGKAVIAASEDSFFVAAFARWTGYDSTDKSIYVRKFDNSGQQQSGDVMVNNYSSGDQWIEDLLIDDNTETIFVVWGSHPVSNPNQRHYYMRTFDFSLNPISDDIPVYIGDDETIWLKDVGFLSSAKIIFAFFHTYDFDYQNVLASYMDFDGSNQSDLFIVNTQQIGIQYWPSITAIQGGGVLIIWSEIVGIYEASIRGRRFDANGNPIDFTDVLLTVPDSNNNGNSNVQNSGHAALNSDGDTYMLTWTQHKNESSAIFKLMGRFLDFTLQPVSDTFTISSTAGCDYPEVLELWPNNFSVTWSMLGDPGYSTDIYGTIVPYPNTIVDYEFVQLPEFQSIAYPNPFNSSTTIKLELDQGSNALVEIYDSLGRQVQILVNEYLGTGSHQINFNADGLPSGTYFYRVHTDHFSETNKVSLLK